MLISMIEMNQRFFVPSPSIASLKSNPTTPIGTDPIITSQPSQASCESQIGRTPRGDRQVVGSGPELEVARELADRPQQHVERAAVALELGLVGVGEALDQDPPLRRIRRAGQHHLERLHLFADVARLRVALGEHRRRPLADALDAHQGLEHHHRSGGALG